MANSIILKRSSTPAKVPTTAQIDLGEIAINTYDGKLYIKKDNGVVSVVEVGGVASTRTAISAGTGISYNNSTGVISTVQNIATSSAPVFAGLQLNGNMGITGDIIPTADNLYSLGSANFMWKDMYVGPGSLYVNGQKVLEDNAGTITFGADANQSLQIVTTGSGNVQLTTDTGGVIQIGSTLQVASGKNITDSAGSAVGFGDNIQMNSNKVIGLGAPSASTDAATKGYVDTAVSAISTSTITQGDSSVAVVDSGTGTVTVTVDGSTALTVTSAGVVVAGNFTVNGTTTTVNSNAIALADNIITLNSDATGTPSQNAGIEVERGDDANVQIRWNEGSTKWTFTNDGAVYYPLARGTDDLAEGVTNKYFSNTLARGAVSATGSTGISYNSGTGTFSLSGIPNSSLSTSSVTVTAGTGLSGGGTVSLGGTVTLTNTITQYTDALARAAISAVDAGGDGSFGYNSTTGVITYTGPSAAEVRAHFTAGTNISIVDGVISADDTSVDWSEIQNKPDPVVTVTLTGDVTGTGSATLTDLASGTVSFATTIAANSVALGTDTTGNYAASVAAGSGITVSGSAGEGTTFTVAHADTSAQANVTASGRTYVTGLTFDTYGHVTGVTTGTETVVDTDTTYSAGGGLTLTGTTFSLTDISSQASLTALTGANVISDIDVDAYGRVTLLATRTMTLGDLGYTGATNANYITNTNQLTNGAGFVTSSGVTSVATGNGLTGGTITSTGTLALSGSYTGNWTVSGEVTAYASDARLKTNVVAIDGALDKVEAIRGVTYDWNELGQELGLGTEQQVGVIAQEIEAVLPQLVVDSAHEGFKTVKYDKLTALLIEAVKELSAKVKTLEARLGN